MGWDHEAAQVSVAAELDALGRSGPEMQVTPAAATLMRRTAAQLIRKRFAPVPRRATNQATAMARPRPSATPAVRSPQDGESEVSETTVEPSRLSEATYTSSASVSRLPLRLSCQAKYTDSLVDATPTLKWLSMLFDQTPMDWSKLRSFTRTFGEKVRT